MVNYSKGLEPNQKTISVWMIYEAEGCFMIMENLKNTFTYWYTKNEMKKNESNEDKRLSNRWIDIVYKDKDDL